MGIFDLKKTSLKVEELKKQEDDLLEQVSNLNKEKEKLSKQMTDLEQSIEQLKTTEKELNEKIANRQDFFVDTELKYIDTLEGFEFEKYICNMFIKLGYEATVTKATQDSGGDVFAKKDAKQTIIQCKNYSSPVGNKAVQEVYSAQGIYKTDEAIVITNNYYTEQAKKEAAALNVELWDRNKLRELLYAVYEFDIASIDNKLFEDIYQTINKNEEDDEPDELLEECVEFAINMGQISASMIQREFKMGYARCGRIIDQMEERGIITGQQGSMPRQVLISKEEWDEMKQNFSKKVIFDKNGK